jgi:hypothetical protein
MKGRSLEGFGVDDGQGLLAAGFGGVQAGTGGQGTAELCLRPGLTLVGVHEPACNIEVVCVNTSVTASSSEGAWTVQPMVRAEQIDDKPATVCPHGSTATDCRSVPRDSGGH